MISFMQYMGNFPVVSSRAVPRDTFFVLPPHLPPAMPGESLEAYFERLLEENKIGVVTGLDEEAS